MPVTFIPALDGQTIVLGSTIYPDSDVHIDASALPGGLTLSGGGVTLLFQLLPGVERVDLTGLTLTAGFSSTTGGAVDNLGEITLLDCTLHGNSATGAGGAIRNSGKLTLVGCTLYGNSASQGGAIISATTGENFTRLARCTVAGNTASTRGGGLWNFRGETFLIRCTVTANSAAQHSGGGVAASGVAANSAFTRCLNTIIAGNAGSDVARMDAVGLNGFISGGHNLIGTGSALNAFIAAGDLVNVTDPRLAALAGYGGPTPTTPPYSGSAAIDAGGATANPYPVDQRGLPRLVDGDGMGGAQVDIGAVEYDGTEVSATVLNNANAGAGSLRSIPRLLPLRHPTDHLATSSVRHPAPAIGALGTARPPFSRLLLDPGSVLQFRHS